jgi:CheY-like chemotaxis protein
MASINSLSSRVKVLTGMQVLVVENDRDSRDLYAVLLTIYGAKVTTIGSVKDALDLLDRLIPDLVICEIRFLGESVYPLIQRVRELKSSRGRVPILVTPTCSPASLAQQLTLKVEAYLRKPIDIDQLVYEVWNLLLMSKTAHLLNTQNWVERKYVDQALCRAAIAG